MDQSAVIFNSKMTTSSRMDSSSLVPSTETLWIYCTLGNLHRKSTRLLSLEAISRWFPIPWTTLSSSGTIKQVQCSKTWRIHTIRSLWMASKQIRKRKYSLSEMLKITFSHLIHILRPSLKSETSWFYRLSHPKRLRRSSLISKVIYSSHTMTTKSCSGGTMRISVKKDRKYHSRRTHRYTSHIIQIKVQLDFVQT